MKFVGFTETNGKQVWIAPDKVVLVEKGKIDFEEIANEEFSCISLDFFNDKMVSIEVKENIHTVVKRLEEALNSETEVELRVGRRGELAKVTA